MSKNSNNRQIATLINESQLNPNPLFNSNNNVMLTRKQKPKKLTGKDLVNLHKEIKKYENIDIIFEIDKKNFTYSQTVRTLNFYKQFIKNKKNLLVDNESKLPFEKVLKKTASEKKLNNSYDQLRNLDVHIFGFINSWQIFKPNIQDCFQCIPTSFEETRIKKSSSPIYSVKYNIYPPEQALKTFTKKNSSYLDCDGDPIDYSLSVGEFEYKKWAEYLFYQCSKTYKTLYLYFSADEKLSTQYKEVKWMDNSSKKIFDFLLLSALDKKHAKFPFDFYDSKTFELNSNTYKCKTIFQNEKFIPIDSEFSPENISQVKTTDVAKKYGG